MNPLRTPGALVAALALAALPATAAAHDGNHPFENCSEAYASGYADIPEGDRHYGSHLDRDGDGIGCDSPPAGFVPADDKDDKESDAGTEGADDTGQSGTDLAETGGSDSTPYIAAGGLVAVLAGGTVMLAVQRRRANR
ncbi:LAETG motif-containing sortase-dependent surface protein [Streptomyces nigra]|uniref:LAETG motif-containing sortase-dependent surface protein n=1 Tax=Streptomyces nigra TaxID=1827580 RepID=UPI003642E6FC